MGVIAVSVTVIVMRVCSFHSVLQNALRVPAYFRAALISAGVTMSPVLLDQLLRV